MPRSALVHCRSNPHYVQRTEKLHSELLLQHPEGRLQLRRDLAPRYIGRSPRENASLFVLIGSRRTLATDTMRQERLARKCILREKLVKIGARIVRHGRYVVFQLAEVAVPRSLARQDPAPDPPDETAATAAFSMRIGSDERRQPQQARCVHDRPRTAQGDRLFRPGTGRPQRSSGKTWGRRCGTGQAHGAKRRPLALPRA